MGLGFVPLRVDSVKISRMNGRNENEENVGSEEGGRRARARHARACVREGPDTSQSATGRAGSKVCTNLMMSSSGT